MGFILICNVAKGTEVVHPLSVCRLSLCKYVSIMLKFRILFQFPSLVLLRLSDNMYKKNLGRMENYP